MDREAGSLKYFKDHWMQLTGDTHIRLVRLILNLKSFNVFLKTDHFKLEDNRVVTKLITRNCYMAKLDLQEAYFSVPLNVADRKFMQFFFDGSLDEFNCLCFGLNCAPMMFTKLMKPVVSLLQGKRRMSVIYLNDFLLLGKEYKECETNVLETESILEYLSFIVNYDKSVLVPKKESVST
nr:unnamed protein product [Callosobruchus chinensis]